MFTSNFSIKYKVQLVLNPSHFMVGSYKTLDNVRTTFWCEYFWKEQLLAR